MRRSLPPIPDALVFDLDGTLWNACATCADAWSEGLPALGYDRRLTKAQLESVCGLPFPDCVRRLCPEVSEEALPAVIARLEAVEHSFLERRGGELYPDVAEGLRELARHRPLYLVSNCQEAYLRLFLAQSGLGDLFEDWECHGRTGRSKTENLQLLAERNGLAAPTYVGDTDGDRTAALAAGYAFAYAAYGFGAVSGVPRFESFAAIVGAFSGALPAPTP